MTQTGMLAEPVSRARELSAASRGHINRQARDLYEEVAALAG